MIFNKKIQNSPGGGAPGEFCMAYIPYRLLVVIQPVINHMTNYTSGNSDKKGNDDLHNNTPCLYQYRGGTSL